MRELPPTAGLPLQWRDLVPGHTPSLTTRLEAMLGVEALQLACSGTAALVAALTFLASRSRRDEVVVPAYTCPLVAMAISRCGLRVVACDLAPGCIDMDPDILASHCGPRTLAVVPTCIGGRVPDIGPVSRIASDAGAAVIEDAAQAMGARHADGTPVGLAGDIGFYSLAAGKGLTMYEGGLLVTRHREWRDALASAIAAMSPRNRWLEAWRGLQLLGYAALYGRRGLVFAYGIGLRDALRRGDIAAATGDVFAARIPLHRVGAWRTAVTSRAALRWPAFARAAKQQGLRRLAQLRRLASITVIDDMPGAHGTWPVLMVRMPDAVSRQRVLSQLWGAGVGISVPFACALPDHASVRDLMPGASTPRARDLAGRLLSISNSPWLDDATFERIVRIIAQACAQSAAAGAAASPRALSTAAG